MPGLVELGVVERREVPPSALFRLVERHVASRALLTLARARATVFEELGRSAGELSPPPVSGIVFGSLARGEVRSTSDVDVVVVRPENVDDEDDGWHVELERWRQEA